jgi:hypothetical protein
MLGKFFAKKKEEFKRERRYKIATEFTKIHPVKNLNNLIVKFSDDEVFEYVGKTNHGLYFSNEEDDIIFEILYLKDIQGNLMNADETVTEAAFRFEMVAEVIDNNKKNGCSVKKFRAYESHKENLMPLLNKLKKSEFVNMEDRKKKDIYNELVSRTSDKFVFIIAMNECSKNYENQLNLSK